MADPKNMSIPSISSCEIEISNLYFLIDAIYQGVCAFDVNYIYWIYLLIAYGLYNGRFYWNREINAFCQTLTSIQWLCNKK